jgi:hypothetical protein
VPDDTGHAQGAHPRTRPFSPGGNTHFWTISVLVRTVIGNYARARWTQCATGVKFDMVFTLNEY